MSALIPTLRKAHMLQDIFVYIMGQGSSEWKKWFKEISFAKLDTGQGVG